MPECGFCGRTDGTHADGCYGSWTRENAPPTYAQLAADNTTLRRQLAAAQAQRDAAQLARQRTAAERDTIASQLKAVREALGANFDTDLIPLAERIRLAAQLAGLYYGSDGWTYPPAA